MKKLILLIFILSQIFILSAQQTTWSKYFDPSVDGETMDFLVAKDSGFILGTNIFCSGTSWYACLYLAELNKKGDVVVDTFLNKDEQYLAIGVPFNNKFIKKKSSYLTGIIVHKIDNGNFQPAVLAFDENLFEVKEFRIYNSLDPNEQFQINTINDYEDKTLIIATSIHNKIDSQEVRPVLIMLDDTLGQILQQKVKGIAEYRQLDNPNFKKLSDGTIACATNVRLYGEGLTDDRHIALFRFDTSGNVIWKKIINKSAWGDKHFYNTDIDQLPNGNIVFNGAGYIEFKDWDGKEYPYPNYVQCNSINGDSIWRTSFKDLSYRKFIVVLKTLPNGNILGGGTGQYLDWDTMKEQPIKRWLFCLDVNGKILWERFYINPGFPDNPSYFRKIVACTDGGILVGTEGRETEQTTGGLWLLKLDSMGCITPDCSGTELYTAVKDEKGAWQDLKEVFFNIYPNPANNILTVDFFSPQPGRKMELLLSDMQGVLIQRQLLLNDKHQEQLDVSGLKPGSYTISLLMNGKVIQSEVIVKE